MSPITPKLFEFLTELSENNDRDWFKANKPRYETEVLDPAVELVSQLQKPLSRVAPMLSAIPKRHGGSVMRIYKDTRFSKEKTPYKTNVGISLRHEANDTIHAPGVYLHLDPAECFLGVGCWRPERTSLAAIRSAIAERPRDWQRATASKRFSAAYQLAGESLKTAPRGYPRTHSQIKDLRRVDFIGIAPLEPNELTAPDIAQRLISGIQSARSLMIFLCDAIGVPY